MNCRHRSLLLATAAVFCTCGAALAAEPQEDTLELDASSVTGNRELPKVMVIVPWKDSGIGELAGRPVNSLLDEVLAPVDREVFQRQIRYHEQLYAADKTPGAAAQSDSTQQPDDDR